MAAKQKNEKILIIEDEQSLVDLLVAKLGKEGYRVESALNGEEGLKKIKSFKPDLILLDIVMPKMTGYEVMQSMKEENISIPVVIISNSGQPVEIEKTKALGAVDHLIKTEFSPLDVLNKVAECLGYGPSKKPTASPVVLNPAESEPAGSLGVKVLLVEDDAFLREICSKKLAKEGFSVYEAIDGEQALNSLEEIMPDIILLDIILPAIDGFQILSQIRHHQNEKIAARPVIMLSNLGQEDDIRKAMDLGAQDYLVKAHFTTEGIIEKIKKVLGK